MKDKFTMELVWHNCKTYQPTEQFNPCLLVTDGVTVYEMMWDKAAFCDGGFLKVGLEIKGDELSKYWWADIEQTVQGEKRFKGKLN